MNWVLDADIAGFFDTIDHQWLIKFLEHRIGDRRILRLIRKWLRAGVSEEGEVVGRRTVGTPSRRGDLAAAWPTCSLHYVFDLWMRTVAQERHRSGGRLS